MSRVFWVAVGAVGGIVAYRKGTQAAARAKELGPLGTAQVAAQATSRLAGRTAHGLGRLNDIKARREGRLVIGSADELAVEVVGPVGPAGADPVAPARPAGAPTPPPAGRGGRQADPSSSGAGGTTKDAAR
jgi:hypothetical protein